MKPSYLVYALLAFALSSSHAQTVNCKAAVTTPDINHCAKQELNIVEAKLNKVYRKFVKELSEPDTEFEKFSEMKSKLIEAQRAWVKFRELDCDAVYTYHIGGSIRDLMYLGCMNQHAEQRIKELERTYGPK
jgi:uncharacterized protein YecT (DUF1311 family)